VPFDRAVTSRSTPLFCLFSTPNRVVSHLPLPLAIRWLLFFIYFAANAWRFWQNHSAARNECKANFAGMDPNNSIDAEGTQPTRRERRLVQTGGELTPTDRRLSCRIHATAPIKARLLVGPLCLAGFVATKIFAFLLFYFATVCNVAQSPHCEPRYDYSDFQ
jgi:hypothetical protein